MEQTEKPVSYSFFMVHIEHVNLIYVVLFHFLNILLAAIIVMAVCGAASRWHCRLGGGVQVRHN